MVGVQSLREIVLSDRKRLIVFVTWLVIALGSVPFERINDDEVIYFLEARHILSVGPITHEKLVFVPQILGALATGIYNSLLAARSVSALVVLATALLIYEIKKDDSTFISSMLYLTSFYTIRFGLRFFLDPYGGLFTMFAIYFLYKGKAKYVGAFSALAAFSRQMAAPLFPIFALLSWRKKLGVWKFAIGFSVVVVIGLVWIYLAGHAVLSAVGTNASEVFSASQLGIGSVFAIVKGWVQYVLISPLVVLGLVFCNLGWKRLEFYPMTFSFLIMSFVPGFVLNGAATEYPYIFNTIACLTSGFGLAHLYERVRPKSKAIVKVAVLVLVAQFAAQSYLATALTVNHTIGVQDYGYWYDQELLSYMNKHYDGGLIYSSTLDVLMDKTIASNVIWVPENITTAVVNNPQWLITYRSYLILKSVPANVTVDTIGPYIVIDRGQVPLSSILRLSNATQFFQK